MARFGRSFPTPPLHSGQPPLLHFHDDFNRANNADAGPDWTPVTTSPITWKLDTNSIVPATGTAQHYIEKNDRTFRHNNHRIKAKHGTLANSFYLPLVRGNATNSIGAWIQSGQLWYIRSYTSLLTVNSPTAVGTQRAVTAAAVTIASADTISLEALNEYYILRKNDIAQLIWQDPGYATHTFVDSAHRDVMMGVYMNGIITGSGMDDIWADDLGLGTFRAAQMTKNGTQAWQTAATWVTITAWTAVNDATHDSVITTDALNVIVGKYGATLAASIPYTGATAGTTHQARIVRIRDSNGGAVTQVVGSAGANVTTATGTVTVSVTSDVFPGEQYRVEMLGSAASAGTITTATPTFTIS